MPDRLRNLTVKHDGFLYLSGLRRYGMCGRHCGGAGKTSGVAQRKLLNILSAVETFPHSAQYESTNDTDSVNEPA